MIGGLDEATTTQRVESSSLEGLRLLRDAGILKCKDGATAFDTGVELFCDSWSSSVEDNQVVQFTDESADGVVVLLNLRGQRLHRGFSLAEESLSRFSELRSLNLGGTDLPLKDTKVVLATVTESIQNLYLGGNGLSDDGATMIAQWLVEKQPANLRKLDLRYNDIGGTGMEALCNALSRTENKNLMFLHLEGNHIGDYGCAALAKLLRHDSCTLVEVFLGANQIQAEGAIHLASSLAVNTILHKLYLEGNNIGLKGANAFSEALEELKENKCLKHFFVDNNGIGKAGSERLTKALNSDSTIPVGF